MKQALIIGAGPSLQENLEDWKRISDGKFDGLVLCTDGAINKTLRNGIIPDYVVTLEDTADLDKYYITDIVKEKGKLLKGAYISDRVHAKTRNAIVAAGMKVITAAKCRGYITSNVGLFSWLTAHVIEDCDKIFLIGMDHCYATGDGPPVDRDSDLFKYGFYTMVNKYDGEDLILHPAFELWKEEFNWYVGKYPNVTTINCTGRGALCEKHMKWIPIKIMKSWEVTY